MLITKCLLLVLFLYGKNTVKTTDKSVVASPGFVACAESGSVTGVPNVDWTVGVSAGRANQGLASGGAIQPVDPATQLKLFKDDSNNDKVPIEAKDFFQDRYRGHLTYVLKKGVMCTLVKFGNKDVWKKGVENVQEPKSVTYDPFMMELAVRDAKYSVHFGMDSQTSDWKHVVTYERGKRLVATKREMTLTFMRPSRSRSSSPKPQFVTSDSSWSMSVTKTASTTLPKQAKAQQEPVKSPEKEADQTSTVPLGTTEDQPESGSGSALRGTSVTAGASGESEDPAKVSSGEGDTTNESGQESTKEGNETEDGGEKEASAEADGTTGSASADDGWTTGGDASSTVAVPEAPEGSTASPGAGQVAGGSGESGEAKSGDSGTSEEAPESTDSGLTTGTGTGHVAEGSGMSAGGDSGTGAGQASEETSESTDPAMSSGKAGEDTSSGRWTSGSYQDGGAQQSSTTPAARTGSQQASSGESAGEAARTAGQSQGSSPSTTAADTSKPVKKTGVELSLKEKKATPQFDYKKQDKVVTFTAKGDNAFKTVKTKKGGHCGSGGTDITIWDAEKPSEYASMVVLDGKGKKQKQVTIHLHNDTKKVYKRDAKDNPWTEVSQQSNQSNDQQASGTPASGTKSEDQDESGTTPADASGTKEGQDGTGTGGEDQDESGTTPADGTGTGGEDQDESGTTPADGSGTKEGQDGTGTGESEDASGTKEGEANESAEAEDGTGGSSAEATSEGS